MRSSDILLGDEHGYHPKLSQCGLVEFGQLEPVGAHFLKQYYGFACLDTVMTGNLTAASSLYSFGVVLLEIFTGRRAIADQAAGAGEDPSIVRWVILHKFCCSLLILTWPSGFRDVIDVMSAAESGSAILQIHDAAPPDG
jgi:hypothetical protein